MFPSLAYGSTYHCRRCINMRIQISLNNKESESIKKLASGFHALGMGNGCKKMEEYVEKADKGVYIAYSGMGNDPKSNGTYCDIKISEKITTGVCGIVDKHSMMISAFADACKSLVKLYMSLLVGIGKDMMELKKSL